MRVDMADYEHGNCENENLEYRFNIRMNRLVLDGFPELGFECLHHTELNCSYNLNNK